MDLDVEPVWLIECWRCANDATAIAPRGAHGARAEFHEMGWRKTDDGYQMCPQCWAAHTACLTVGRMGQR